MSENLDDRSLDTDEGRVVENGDALSPLITKYCQDYPNVPTQTLAKTIVAQNPHFFSEEDVEKIRSRIRYRRGANGKKSRESRAKEFSDLSSLSAKEAMDFFNLEEEKVEMPDFLFPDHLNNSLLINDLHIPYHVRKAVEITLDAAKKRGVDSIIINGDLIDFYGISRFLRDPTRRNITYELEMVDSFLDFLQSFFPGVEIFYKCGNHDARWSAFFRKQAAELAGDPYMTLQARLGLEDRGITWIDSTQKINYGALSIVHGHEFGNGMFSPVNAARGLFLRAHTNAIMGHSHQTSNHNENNLDNTPIACWSVGALCSLKPEYKPFSYAKCNWGYALLEKSGKDFEVDNRRIRL